MIDPLLARLERFEQDNRKAPVKRQKPAHSAKIIVAGASATALLSMVAAMGFQSGTSSANSGTAPADPIVTDAAATGPAFTLPLPTVATTTTPITTPTTPATAQPTLPPTVPSTAAPVVTQAPVVIPVAVPAAPTVTKHKSHTVSKSSG
jgi:hypothetical protein